LAGCAISRKKYTLVDGDGGGGERRRGKTDISALKSAFVPPN